MKIAIPVLLSVIAAVMVLGSMSPALAGSDGSYKNWAVSIGEASGTIEIGQDDNVADFEDRAISLDEISADYSDVQKTMLGKAVNDDGTYFLVWNLVSFDDNGMTVHVLDAGTGEPLIEPIIKEAGSCGKSRTGTGA